MTTAERHLVRGSPKEGEDQDGAQKEREGLVEKLLGTAAE